MATNVGDLVVKLGADTREFESAMARATGPQSALGKLGPIAAGAALAAGAAIAGFSSKGVADFMKLDTQMREVFTLLPGITQENMDLMTAEVLEFSREFGKLPDEVVPALYDALSAGVPPENVFAFLETANMAAVGGVTSLNTAVDALTSVTNAYGLETISTQEASDNLFTAVRLGKTTMDELGREINKVAPIAASLGVNFGDVTAALAALTAQGVPTNVAATQLRSLLNELGTAGSKAFDVFKLATGQTFPQFIAGGGTVEGALQAMAEHSEKTQGRIADSFGSVEASMAATALTSETGSLAFGNALAAMDNSAGATQAAFDTMDAGIQASWNRLKAGFATLSAEVGEKLGPMFKKGVDWVVDTGMPALRDGVMAAFEKIEEFTDTLTEVWNRYQTDSDGIFANVRGFVEAAAGAIGAAFTLIKTAWENVLKPAWDAIEPLVSGILNALVPIVTTAFETIEGVLNALSALMRGDFKTAWEEMQGVVTTITEGIEKVLTEVWNGIKTFLGERFEAIKKAAEDRWNEMRAAIEGVVTGLKAWLEETWEAIKTWLGELWGGIVAGATEKWESVESEIRKPIQAVWDWIVETWNEIKAWLDELWGSLGGLATLTFGAVKGAIEGALGGLGDFVAGVFQGVVATIGNLIDGIVGRIQSAWESITALGDAVSAAVEDATATLTGARDTANSWFEERMPEWMQNLPGVRRDAPDAGSRALGGIVTGPMRAIIGESGPEAVIPLERLDRMIGGLVGTGGGNQTIIVELDGQVLMRSVAPRMVDTLRLKTGLAGV